MDESRQFRPEAQAALVALAQGACQFPGCRTPIPVADDLGPLTAARLDDLLTTAFVTAKERVDEALAAFAKVDPSSARLLGGIMTGLHGQRGRYGADPRLASALARVLDALTEPPRRQPRPDRVNVGWRSGHG
jgi:hypothetical protein